MYLFYIYVEYTLIDTVHICIIYMYVGIVDRPHRLFSLADRLSYFEHLASVWWIYCLDELILICRYLLKPRH